MNHTFANFIVGSSNRLAHQAALTIANDPDVTFNPLLIRAASGLGKTHLLHAIGERIRENQAPCEVTYLTPGRLSHALHNALKNGRIDTLRDQYLKSTILLMDDLQEIAGRSHTQKLLLHIFDELMNSGRRIVLASTTMPQSITSLDQRLRSRLSCSAIVEIQPAEPETCKNLLLHKAALHRLPLSDSTAELVATGTGKDLRELENRLARLAAYASLHDRPINDALVREVLLGKHPTDERKISVIQQTVANYFGIRISDIKTKRRTHTILIPRQIAMYLSHESTGTSLQEIGRLFGGRSTSSVQHACRRIEQLTHGDVGIAGSVRSLRSMLANQPVDNSDIGFPQEDQKQVCG